MKQLMSLFPIQVVEKIVKENKAHVWRWWPNRGMIKTTLNRENYHKPKLSLKKWTVCKIIKKDERWNTKRNKIMYWIILSDTNGSIKNVKSQ